MELHQLAEIILIMSCLIGLKIGTANGTTALQTQSNHERVLRENLLSNYNPNIRPVLNSSKPLNLTLNLFFTAIQNLDERNQVLKAALWINMHWHDAFMSWNPVDHGGVERLIFHQNELWVPDIGLYNSADSVFGDLFDPNFKAILDFDGNVSFAVTGTLRVSCPLQVRKYPFDNQTCFFFLAPWSYNQEEVYFREATYATTFYRENGEWNLTGFGGKLALCPFSGIRMLWAKIEINRKPQFILMNLFIPCVFISILCMMVFLLPAESGEKVSLGITVLLSFAVFLLVISDNLPKSSDEVPLLSLFVILTMALASLSLGCSVLVLNFHHKTGATPVPAWIKLWIMRYLGGLLCCSRIQSPHLNKIKIGDNLPSVDEMMAEVENIYKNKTVNAKVNLANFTGLETIESHLCGITRTMERQQTEEEKRKEWQEVAAILDRLFLILYMATLTVMSLVVMGIIPNTG